MSSYQKTSRSSLSAQRDESILIGVTDTERVSEKNYDSRIVILLLIIPIWTFLFTALPVLINFQGVLADLYRIVEPIVGLPLYYFLLLSADVFTTDINHKRKFAFGLSEKSFLGLWFMIAGSIYTQGAAMHATAIMAKHEIENAEANNPQMVLAYPVVKDVENYYRDTLEHLIGHYMYAGGAILIALCNIIAFRNQRHNSPHSVPLIIGWVIGSLMYGILIAGVAIEFPKGTIVGLVYTLVLGILLGIFLIRVKGISLHGRCLVLQYYLMSSVVALIIIVIWICIHGFTDRKSAGYLTN
ncbi:5593_t:CDS:2 [Paraglomus occultum]|uniref:5593_t:CDS:1 n=1 Tax=Paraglomus occultum TaxID=144539 RepID=A0A9N9GCM2_9GLOM|nr:5593_t:CDS:2 [Paraglomus occultum]